MSTLSQPTNGNYWEVVDKEPGATVYTLTVTGELKAWRATHVEHTVLMFPEVEAAATWCIDARNQHLHLSRTHGWRLEWRAGAFKDGQVYVCVWWEELTETTEFIGPLLDLDVAIRRYFSRIDAPEESPES